VKAKRALSLFAQLLAYSRLSSMRLFTRDAAVLGLFVEHSGMASARRQNVRRTHAGQRLSSSTSQHIRPFAGFCNVQA
jgi:hypothetical protein